jgi:hypothetical protein
VKIGCRALRTFGMFFTTEAAEQPAVSAMAVPSTLIFPNVETARCVCICNGFELHLKTYSLFSKLKYIKNEMTYGMAQKRLNILSLMSVKKRIIACR